MCFGFNDAIKQYIEQFIIKYNIKLSLKYKKVERWLLIIY